MRNYRLVALLTILGLIMGLVVASTATAQSSSIEASADAHIKVNQSSTGGEASLALRGTGSQEHWAIFKFTGVTAGTADIRVRVTTVRTGTLSLFTAGNDWAESPSFTWANKPAIGASPLATMPQPAAPGDVTFANITVPAGDVSFWLKASYDKGLTFVAAREHTTLAGPTLIQGSAPTTTTAAPTTTTVAPTTTTAAPTTTTVAPTTTTLPPNPNCLLSTNYASVQAAVDDTGGADGDPMCVTINELETVGGPVTAKTGVTVQCLDQAHGLTGTSAWALFVISNVSDFNLQGCRLTSSGPTDSAAVGIDLSGTLTRIRLADLLIRNVEAGIVGAPTITGTAWTDTGFGLRVLNTRTEFTAGSGVGLYQNGTTRYVEVSGSTIIGHQRSGTAGRAGIQSGALSNSTENVDRHLHWRLLDNVVDSSPAAVGTPTGCPNGDLVDIGLDQIGFLLAERNTIRHCLGNGEGFVTVGHDITSRNNAVYDKGGSGGAFVMISYGQAPQQVRNVVFEDNLADGNNTPSNQGLAISFGPSGLPIQNVVVRRFTAVQQSLGIQSYPYQGTQAGDVRIEDSNPGGAGPDPWCGGLGPLDATVINTPNCPS